VAACSGAQIIAETNTAKRSKRKVFITKGDRSNIYSSRQRGGVRHDSFSFHKQSILRQMVAPKVLWVPPLLISNDQ
jgi:hypothetical protein